MIALRRLTAAVVLAALPATVVNAGTPSEGYLSVLDQDGRALRQRSALRRALEADPAALARHLSLTDSLSLHVHNARPQVITDFRDGSHRVEIPAAPHLDYRDAFSCSLWLWLEGDHMVAHTKIFSQAGVSTGKVTVMGIGRRINVLLRYDDGSETMFRTVAKIPVRRWVHLALSFERDDGLSVHLDGVEQRLRRRGEAIVGRPLLSIPDQEIYVGGLDRTFPGRIDELRIYDRALSKAECQALARGDAPGRGLIGHWPFDRVEEGSTPDLSGRDVHALVGEGIIAGLDGRLGESLGFDRQVADWSEQLRALEFELEKVASGVRAELEATSHEELLSILRRRDSTLLHFVPVDGEARSLDAWILDPRAEPPIARIRLEPSPDWESLLSEMLDELRRGEGDETGEARFRGAARALAAELWDPLEAHFDEGREIWLRLTPRLRDIPFAALVDGEGRYLLERFAFARCGPVGTLPRRQAGEGDDSRRMVAMVNPDFGAIGDGNSAQRPMRRQDAQRWRSQPADGSCRVDGPPLSGTLREAEAILPLAREAGFDAVQLFEWQHAQEHILDDVGDAGVLHVATHGYQMSLECLPTAPRDPLLLSGVALAGAFRHLPDGYRGADEGLLSAAEVAGLDLQGTRLLVWSGCSTATGYSLPDEAMCGMAAAAWLAGAGCSVATLWRVSDERMPLQMEAMYRAWFEGQSPARSVRAALRAGLDASARAYGHTHPSRWAALVVEGQ